MNPPDPSVLPGPKLQRFGENLLRYIESLKPVAGLGTSIIETGSGRAINAAPRGGGGGGGTSSPETVTGAVNGVPATLVVMTDGNGWTEI